MHTIAGRYRVERELGRGGMASVLLATDTTLNRPVALKLLERQGASPQRRERFRLEGEALARIAHPHVVGIHAVGEDGDQPYLVLDYVEGESLAERLEREGPLAACDAAELVRDLAAGLAAAHDAGILHRDVKPANVLLRAVDGSALLTDFGLARELEDSRAQLTKTGVMLGTPGYLAPEQASKVVGEVGKATDVWGLGALLYALLTGEPPIEGDDTMQIMVRTIEPRIEPPSRRAPGVDPELERLCLRCLERDPAARYPDARALEQALAAYLRGERAARGVPRWALAAGATAVLALGGALLLWWTRPPRPAPAVAVASPQPAAKPKVTPREPKKDLAVVRARRGVDEAAARKLAVAAAQRGVAAHNAGRLQEALEAYSETLSYMEASNIYHSRANVKRELGDLEGSLSDLDASLRLKPKNAFALGERGKVLWLLRRHEDALRDFSASLALEEEEQVRYEHGDLLRELGRFAEALDDARILDERLPRSSAGPRLAMRVYHLQRDLPRALAAAREALRRKADDLTAMCHEAEFLFQLGRPEEALAAAERLLRLRPEEPEGLRLRGVARIKLGDLERGRADLERYLLRSPDSPNAALVRRDLEALRRIAGQGR
ncbi:MAG: tetratricopeptide repeat protein [Planctomycetota bacterium]